MRCPKCHFENPAESIYCSKCATKLDLKAAPSVSVTKTLEATPDELVRGTTFASRYEIIEELGTGGMGKVYRAFDKKVEEEVALKLLRPEIAADYRPPQPQNQDHTRPLRANDRIRPGQIER